MCMEDIRIGRKATGRELGFTTPAAGALQVLSGSNDRFSVILGGPLAGTLTYSTNPNPTSGIGFNVAAGQPPIVLRVAEVGEIVCHQWWVIGDAAARVGAVVENLLADQ